MGKRPREAAVVSRPHAEPVATRRKGIITRMPTRRPDPYGRRGDIYQGEGTAAYVTGVLIPARDQDQAIGDGSSVGDELSDQNLLV